MADHRRWRNEPERYGYRDDRWRTEGGREDFGPGDSRGRGFYSGSAADARGYGGYGGGGGDVRSGRFSDRARHYQGRESRPGRSYAQGADDYSGGFAGADRGYGPDDYERPGYGDWGMPLRRWQSRWSSDPERGGEARAFLDRASDEVSSWFGDENAERRRRMDEMRAGEHRGRGPKGYTRSDERIREDVCDRLTDDPRVDASEIDVAVSQGEVILSGMVDSREAKRRAEDCAERVSGVRHVQNNMRVGPGIPASGGITTSGRASTSPGTPATAGRRKTATT
jgi:osmotically-inducible protein OsmY